MNENLESKEEQFRFNTTRAPYNNNNDGLDYAFKFHRAKIQSRDRKDKGKMEEYVFDLENTWSLNMEIFQNLLQDLPHYTNDQKKSFISLINRIKTKFINKKSLREEKQRTRGKLLMDKQILEEYKRRNEENNAYYQEQMDEFKENVDKKDSFIKQFEKKFNEVEIFVQREAKNNPEKWDRYLTFEILGFICNNEMLHRRRIKIDEEVKIIKEDMKEILKENVELKKRDEFIEEDSTEEYDLQMSKYNSLIKLYRSKIKFLERNSEHLRSVLKGLNCRLETIVSHNVDLNEKIKSGITKPKLKITFKPINTTPFNEDKFKELKSFRLIKKTDEPKSINILDESKDISQNSDIDDGDVENENGCIYNRTFGEINGPEDEDVNNKSRMEIFSNTKKKVAAEMITDTSMIKAAPDVTMHKENWDISCINFTEN